MAARFGSGGNASSPRLLLVTVSGEPGEAVPRTRTPYPTRVEYRATDSHPGSEYRRSTDRCRYGSVVARLQASRNQEVGLNDLPPDDSGHPLATAFKLFLQQPAFPCVAAKAGLSRDQFTFVVARDLRSGCDDLRVYPALLAFVSRYRRNRARFSSFVVLFEGPATLSEAKFEHHLWARLQSLSDKNAWLGLPYDDRVDLDPARLVFIDETWASTNMARRYGRAPRGLSRLRWNDPAMTAVTRSLLTSSRRSGVQRSAHHDAFATAYDAAPPGKSDSQARARQHDCGLSA